VTMRDKPLKIEPVYEEHSQSVIIVTEKPDVTRRDGP
jgi:hypothetical protein